MLFFLFIISFINSFLFILFYLLIILIIFNNFFLTASAAISLFCFLYNLNNNLYINKAIKEFLISIFSIITFKAKVSTKVYNK